jgi:hypothetical protein
MATKYNKNFSGYQPRQVVEWRKTNISRTMSILVLRVLKWLEFPSVSYIYQPLQYPEDEDGDGPRNVGFFTIQPLDAAGSPRRFCYTV